MKAQSLKLKVQEQQGSAIILALLVVSTVSVASFSISKVLISEIRIESGLEDASGAYMTAEASLENGLVEYRKNRNYQVSAEFAADATKVPFQDGSGTMFNATPREVALGSNLTADAQAAELVWFNAVSPASQAIEAVGTDELIEKDIRAIQLPLPGGVQNNNNCSVSSGSGIKFCWNWASGGRNRTMEIALLDAAGNLIPGFPIYESGTERIVSVPAGATTLRFRPIGSGLAPSGNSGTPAFRPAYAFNTFGKPMDAGISRIEATGRFGKSQRKLKVEIDRKRDALITEFDFTVFSGSDL